jgi:hypothetical protein
MSIDKQAGFSDMQEPVEVISESEEENSDEEGRQDDEESSEEDSDPSANEKNDNFSPHPQHENVLNS